MWIETYNGRFINTDKLASILGNRERCNDEYIYCIYGIGVINYLGNCYLDKNAICICRISDTKKEKWNMFIIMC